MSNPYEITEYRHEPGGAVMRREYRHEGVLHRDPEEGPAVELFYEDGTSAGFEYFVDGEQHRDGAPAVEWCFDAPKGAVYCRDYYQHGNRHRDPAAGPAVTWFDEAGDEVKSEFWVSGCKVDDPEGLVLDTEADVGRSREVSAEQGAAVRGPGI